MAKKGWNGMMQRRGMIAADETGGTSSLANRINHSSMGNITFSGRGHGRKTPHGRGPKRDGPRTTKRDMLYFVRDIVRMLRTTEPHWVTELANTHDLADVLANGFQFFDCDEIYEYVWENLSNIYPDPQVPPSEDVILPAELVGLYTSKVPSQDGNEVLLLCAPTRRIDREDERFGKVFSVVLFGKGHLEAMDPEPTAIGFVDALNGTFEEDFRHTTTQEGRTSVYTYLRTACAMLQTINTPRFVIAGKRDVSLVKRQSFKKATGRFTPDSWNMVTWNIEAPIKSKDYKEGTGGRQALHFRRGYWRKAEKDWERSRWSEQRNRWEQYIHGYEAGHPAFGVKKSYHLPRKE